VRRLWEVCRVPDFRKTMAEAHVRLVGDIYRYLRTPEGVLPTDWVARHMAALERTDGDIDTLATRIAHVRTWTYVSHRPDWIADPRHWQERARAIEDRLSDALHAGLTQRFVDRRTAVLARRLRENDELRAVVDEDGGVAVEGEFVGQLEGLAFEPDPHSSGSEGRALRAAARRALRSEIDARVERLVGGPDRDVALDREGLVWWGKSRLARLEPGEQVLKPRLELVPNELLEGAVRERVRRHLEGWLERWINKALAPLLALNSAALNGAARGLAFQLVEGLGALARRGVAEQVRALGPSERRRLNRLGVRFGTVDLYLPALLNRPAANLRAILWAAHAGALPAPSMPRRATAIALAEVPPELYRASGFTVYGGRAVRLDAVEKLASAARRLAAAGPFQATRELAAIVGGDADDLAAALADLGYRASQEDGGETLVFSRKPPRGRGKGERKKGARRPAKRTRVDPHSPFAKLKDLKVPAR
jgi:ATP-dependent RNA helicase SUPV3L1/SUV3